MCSFGGGGSSVGGCSGCGGGISGGGSWHFSHPVTTLMGRCGATMEASEFTGHHSSPIYLLTHKPNHPASNLVTYLPTYITVYLTFKSP